MMTLGKRPRPPMKRTTSMSEFAADPGVFEGLHLPEQDKSHHHHQNQHPRDRYRPNLPPHQAADGGAPVPVGLSMEGMDPRFLSAMVSPRNNHRRNSGDFSVVETAQFLRNCGLCDRRLVPGRDIYMYRGEIAFCSLECRQQQMNHDERKEKCALAPMKKDSPPVTTGSESSGSSETVVAA